MKSMFATFIRLLWKEMFDLIRQPLVLAAIFIAPIGFLAALSSFSNTDGDLRVLILAPAGQEEDVNEVKTKLTGISDYQVFTNLNEGGLPQLMAAEMADIAVLLDGELIRIIERSPSRSLRRRNLAATLEIQHVLATGDLLQVAAATSLWGSEENEIGVESLSLAVRNDAAVRAPIMLALIFALLPTVLAARSYLRDAQVSALSLLLTAPGGGWGVIVTAKMAAAIILSLGAFAASLISLEAIVGLAIKPHLIQILLAVLLVGISASALGLTISVLFRDAAMSYAMIALLLIANLVFTGVMAPISSAHWAVEAGSHLFPLTFLWPILDTWLLYGDPAFWSERAFMILVLHSFGSVMMLAICVNRAKMRL